MSGMLNISYQSLERRIHRWTNPTRSNSSITTICPDRLTIKKKIKIKRERKWTDSFLASSLHLKGLIHAHTYRYPLSLSRYSSTTASWLANSYVAIAIQCSPEPDRIPTCTQPRKIEDYPRRLINSSARGLKVQIGRFNHVVGSWYRRRRR